MKKCIWACALVFLTACSTSENIAEHGNKMPLDNNLKPEQLSIISEEIAGSLNRVIKPIKGNERVAVMSFKSVSMKENADEVEVSKLLRESLLSKLSMLGVKLVEHRTKEYVTYENAKQPRLDYQPEPGLEVDYVVLGSILGTENDYVINTRLVDTSSNLVLSSHSTRLAKNVNWSIQKIQIRDGYLYRNSY